METTLPPLPAGTPATPVPVFGSTRRPAEVPGEPMAAAPPGPGDAAGPEVSGIAANDTETPSLTAQELAALLAEVPRPAVQLAIVRLLQTLNASKAASPPRAAAQAPAPLPRPTPPAPDKDAMAAAVRELRNDMVRRSGRVALQFRPLANARVAGIVGFESSIRWRRNSGVTLDDTATRHLAAHGGLAEQLDFMLLQELSYYAAEWAALAPECLITLPVSAQFLADTLARRALSVLLRASGARPQTLCLVVPAETLAKAELVAVLARAAELGLRIGLDGFGPAHLPLLKGAGLPVHLVRLATALRRGGEDAGPALATCQEIVRALHVRDALSMAVDVASQAEAVFWARAGVDISAGGWYSEAVSPTAAAAMLQSRDNLPWCSGRADLAGDGR